jgi:hypothetical protein
MVRLPGTISLNRFARTLQGLGFPHLKPIGGSIKLSNYFIAFEKRVKEIPRRPSCPSKAPA